MVGEEGGWKGIAGGGRRGWRRRRRRMRRRCCRSEWHVILNRLDGHERFGLPARSEVPGFRKKEMRSWPSGRFHCRPLPREGERALSYSLQYVDIATYGSHLVGCMERSLGLKWKWVAEMSTVAYRRLHTGAIERGRCELVKVTDCRTVH